MRRTKIVATIGPASDSPEVLLSLLKKGVDVCRLNYSHGSPKDKTPLYELIRSFEGEIGRPTCIIADLPGPKLRLGNFPGVVRLKRGTEVELHCGVSAMEDANMSALPVEYSGLSDELQVGDPVLIADGLISLKVTSTPNNSGGVVICKVEDGGHVSARKGINVPGTLIELPAIGPKDEAAMNHALASGADYIAVSYVRNAVDLQPAKEAIKAAGLHVPVIAKIEHPSALENLDEILDAADAVMVARGDLGVDIPLEEVPVVQQRIIDGALSRGMIVIVATQMLESMTLNPRPTRAEASDVSTAIRHGGTAIMLSGETASGDFPLLAVETMGRIAQATENGLAMQGINPSTLARFKSTRAVAHAGVELAKMSKASRIIVATEHGNAPRLVSGHRPDVAITAVTDRISAARRVHLLPGVDCVIVKEHNRGSATMQEAIQKLLDLGEVRIGEKIVAISGSPLAMRGATSTIRLYEIGPNGDIIGSE